MNGTLMHYAPQIVAWSELNFGNQTSKADGRELNELAPLMGIVEEIGEYYDSENFPEKVDSLVDIVIFLCDYAGRSGLDIAGMAPAGVTERHMRDLVVQVALLQRYTLKQAQGIRSASLVEPRVIIPKIVCIAENIYGRLARKQCVTRSFWEMFAAIADQVLARNWTKDPETGRG